MTDDSRQRALALWEEGSHALLSGDVDEAISLFTTSLEVAETAEGYTFRGWAYSFQGRIDEAIEECKRAIAVDPDYGNPYNDIGCYLVQVGPGDEAPEWFEKAKRAPRYESRHFPWVNLGRWHMARSNVAEAISEFHGALEVHPGDPVALAFLEKLKLAVN